MDNVSLNGEINSYINSLTKQSIIFFITSIEAIVDDFTGELVSILSRDTFDQEHFITGFIKLLENEVFGMKTGRSLGEVDYAKLEELIQTTPYYTSIIDKIKNEFFKKKEISDNYLPKEELFNSVFFLTFNNAFIFYMKQFFVSFEFVDFAIVRKHVKINSVNDLKERGCFLIKKKTFTSKVREY
jgi:hypothetical protein